MLRSYPISSDLNEWICKKVCDINWSHILLSSFLLLLLTFFDYFVDVAAEAIVLISVLVEVAEDIVFLLHLFEAYSQLVTTTLA